MSFCGFDAFFTINITIGKLHFKCYLKKKTENKIVMVLPFISFFLIIPVLLKTVFCSMEKYNLTLINLPSVTLINKHRLPSAGELKRNKINPEIDH